MKRLNTIETAEVRQATKVLREAHRVTGRVRAGTYAAIVHSPRSEYR